MAQLVKLLLSNQGMVGLDQLLNSSLKILRGEGSEVVSEEAGVVEEDVAVEEVVDVEEASRVVEHLKAAILTSNSLVGRV